MTVEVSTTLLVGMLLASVRAAAWLAITPPLNGRQIPAMVKAGLSVALALPVVQQVSSTAPPPEAGPLLVATVVQVVVGLSLGFLTLLLLAAIQAAGDMMDLFGGFSLAQAYDPLNLTQSSVLGRLHGLLMLVLLFALNGHLLLIRGFLASYDAVGLSGGLNLTAFRDSLLSGMGTFLLAAVEIAAPLMAVSFLADLGLGLLSKTAPSLNVFALGFPVKIGLTMVVVGLTLPLLPGMVSSLVDTGLGSVGSVLRAGG